MKLLISLVVLLAFVAVSYQEKVKLTLYYESLCPYCSRFSVNQLKPVYEHLGKEYVTVDFVPYGHATHEKVNGKWEFTCQHGEWECYGNKVQACMLNSGLGQDTEVDYEYCTSSQADPSSLETQELCCNELGLNWDELYECSVNGTGDDLLAQYGDRTHAFIPEYKPRVVPTVVFNDQYNATLQDAALTNLYATICSLYTDKPNTCPLSNLNLS